MHATEYTLPRRPAAPQARGLGTPVTSLPGATRVDEDGSSTRVARASIVDGVVAKGGGDDRIV